MTSKADKQRDTLKQALAYKRGETKDVEQTIIDISDSLSEKELELFSDKTNSKLKPTKDSDRDIQNIQGIIDSILMDIYIGTMNNTLQEGEYNGNRINLNEIMLGDSSKYMVYIKNPINDNIVKVNFGKIK